jgi:ADP-ribose pyrophosphatase YjhB (NUDIX family)
VNNNTRDYPARPILAVSAAIIREDRVLLVRRARPPALGLFTLPGGAVETGETLAAAVKREIREETGLDIDPIALAGYHEAIAHDAAERVRRHYVILTFAARWRGGDPVLNAELGEARWVELAGLAGLPTTDGLAPIVERAFACLQAEGG